MKNLFSIKNFAAAVLACGVMFSFSSCEEDLCKDVTCVQGTATESNGSCACVCDTGYEGSDCNTLSREKFVGTYNFSDNCLSTGYSQSVTAGNEVDKIVFSNLGNFSTAAVVTANVELNTLVISFTDATGRVFTGNGQLNGNNLSLTYSVTYTDNTTETCTITGVKQ